MNAARRVFAGGALLAAAMGSIAGGQTLVSSDGLWTATIDSLGQVTNLYASDQPTADVLAHTTVFEASPDGQNLSRGLAGNYTVSDGPTVDQNQTHSFTRLENAVGGGAPPSGDCCVEHAGAGCEDPVCEAAVCDIDSFCCDVEWDETCAITAQKTAGCDCVGNPLPLSIEIENLMVSGAGGGVLVTIRAVNKSPTEPISVKLFYYADYDIIAPNDEATAVFQGGNLLAIEQFSPQPRTFWFGGCPPYKSWEIDYWPDLLDNLEAGVAQLSSSDHTVPGPNDHTCALSTGTASLGPGASLELRVGMGAPDFSGCVSACPWDLDGSGAVAVADLLALLSAWGPNPGHPADFDGDGAVAVTDLLKLLSNWGPCA